MKILTGNDIRLADSATIERESITGLALMERAAEALSGWLLNRFGTSKYVILAGKGNNGGDGLAMARLLHNARALCTVVLPYKAKELSDEGRANFKRIPDGVRIIGTKGENPDPTNKSGDIFPLLDRLSALCDRNTIVIDALIGSGLTGPARRKEAEIIAKFNNLQKLITVSIDLPSGMPSEVGFPMGACVKADVTLTIEYPKLPMLLPGTGAFCGETVVVPIALNREFIEAAHSPFHYCDREFIRTLLRGRGKFAHKGVFGHVLLICGSKTMPGAGVLAVGGALRSGCGLVTAHVPETNRIIMGITCPSAILSIDPKDTFSELPGNADAFSAIGVGCGIGTSDAAYAGLTDLFSLVTNVTNDGAVAPQLILDADALNIIAMNRDLLRKIPPQTILAPHPGELRRLIGDWMDDGELLAKVKDFSESFNVFTIVKGAHTLLCTPDGRYFFNSTGTPGMAKGGSGDVLTGLITGLCARGYPPEEAAQLGVWLHGRAGEKAAAYYGVEAMNSSDLEGFIGEAFDELYNDNE